MTSLFDGIRHVENGQEFWNGRELMGFLDYADWKRFSDAIDRAIVSCQVHGAHVADHFSRSITKTGGRPREDYKLSRFGAYLVAMNSDPRKRSVAGAQAYFCVKTRQAELALEPKPLPAVRKVAPKARSIQPTPAALFYNKECENYPRIDLAFDSQLTDAEIVRAVDYNLRICTYLVTRLGSQSPVDAIACRARLLSNTLNDIVCGPIGDLNRQLPAGKQN